MGDLMSANAVWDAYLRRKGYLREMASRNCTIASFAAEHPCGEYVIGTGAHATAVVDGDIYDIWDCSEEIPLYFYHKETDK